MNWRQLSSEPKPAIHHCYHYKAGKREGYAYYGVNGFEVLDVFCKNEFLEEPDEEIFWLDEMAPDVELTVNALKDIAKQWHTQKTETMVNGGSFRTFDQIVIDKIKELENLASFPILRP